MSRQKKGSSRIVFSTDPGFDYDNDAHEEQETLPPGEQHLYISHDRKQRKGKVVTLVEGFIGKDSDLKKLEKFLKARCGVGGSSKRGEIILQGALREKVLGLLEEDGYIVKLKGGQ